MLTRYISSVFFIYCNCNFELTCYTLGYPEPKCKQGESWGPWCSHTQTHSISSCHLSIPKQLGIIFQIMQYKLSRRIKSWVRYFMHKTTLFYATQRAPLYHVFSMFILSSFVFHWLLGHQKKSENSSTRNISSL